MNLDECCQNNGKVETKFAIANRPSDVVSRIHVYVDLDVGRSSSRLPVKHSVPHGKLL